VLLLLPLLLLLLLLAVSCRCLLRSHENGGLLQPPSNSGAMLGSSCGCCLPACLQPWYGTVVALPLLLQLVLLLRLLFYGLVGMFPRCFACDFRSLIVMCAALASLHQHQKIPSGDG